MTYRMVQDPHNDYWNIVTVEDDDAVAMVWEKDDAERFVAALNSVRPEARAEMTMPRNDEIRLAMGEMTADQMRTAKAAIRWILTRVRPEEKLAEAAAKFRDAFDYDPGQWDLDDQQPISIHVTLGDWRRLNMLLPQQQRIQEDK